MTVGVVVSCVCFRHVALFLAPGRFFRSLQIKPKPVEDDGLDTLKPSPVIRLSNMVGLEELEDDTEYADIKTDVAEECGQYGKVK